MKIIIHNNYSKFKLETQRDFKVVKDLAKKARFFAPSYRYAPGYKTFLKTNGRIGWDGKIGVLRQDGSFLTGLLPFFLDQIPKNLNLKIIDNRKVVNSKNSKVTVLLRDYQEEALNKLFDNKISLLGGSVNLPWYRGIFEMATGSGKTETAIAAIQRIDQPTIFFVHKLDLMKQTIERLKFYNLDVGYIQGDNFQPGKDVTVATAQTVYSIYKNKYKNPSRWNTLFNYLSTIGFEIWDEAHMIASSTKRSNIFAQVAGLNPNSYYRLGLTATPFMKEQISNAFLQGATGTVLYKIRSIDLINKGYLVEPKITMIRSKAKFDKVLTEYSEIYKKGIVQSPDRNKQIVDKALESSKPCLILVKMIFHGKVLYDLLKHKNNNVAYISGTTPIEVRKEKIKDLIEGKLEILITTSIFDEGIDIPNLSSLILAGGGKSKVKTIQRLGRGLRASPGKKFIEVVDFVDKAHNMLYEHSKQRYRTWKEQGFKVEVRDD